MGVCSFSNLKVFGSLRIGGIGCPGRSQHRRQDGVAQGARFGGAHGEGRHVPARPARLSRCRSIDSCSTCTDTQQHPSVPHTQARGLQLSSGAQHQYVTGAACHLPTVLTKALPDAQRRGCCGSTACWPTWATGRACSRACQRLAATCGACASSSPPSRQHRSRSWTKSAPARCACRNG